MIDRAIKRAPLRLKTPLVSQGDTRLVGLEDKNGAEFY